MTYSLIMMMMMMRSSVQKLREHFISLQLFVRVVKFSRMTEIMNLCLLAPSRQPVTYCFDDMFVLICCQYTGCYVKL